MRDSQLFLPAPDLARQTALREFGEAVPARRRSASWCLTTAASGPTRKPRSRYAPTTGSRHRAVDQRIVILRVLAGEHAKARRPPPQQVDRLRAVGAAILHAHDVRMFGKPQQRLVVDVDRGAVGDGCRARSGARCGRRARKKCCRRDRAATAACNRDLRSGNRRPATPMSHPAHRAAFACRRPTARGRPGRGACCRKSPPHHRHEPLELGHAERHALARGAARINPSTGPPM